MPRLRTFFSAVVVAATAACSESSTGTDKPTGTDWRGTFSRHDSLTYGYNCSSGTGTCGATWTYVSPALEVSWAGGGTFVATGRTTSNSIQGGTTSNVRSYDEIITIQNRADSVYLETEYGAVPRTSITATGIVAVSTDPTEIPCTKLFTTLGDVSGRTCRAVTRWVRID